MTIELKPETRITDATHGRFDTYPLRWYDDGDGPLWLFGFEFGPSMVIRARHFETAWEIMLDESKAIPKDEVPEAYGIPDFLRDKFELEHPNPMREGTKWARFWRAIEKRGEAHSEVYTRIMRRLDKLARDSDEEYPELIEGYEYQPNAGRGTGIVSVGEYAWLREMERADFAEYGIRITIEKE